MKPFSISSFVSRIIKKILEVFRNNRFWYDTVIDESGRSGKV
jgi:hypothetical protein